MILLTGAWGALVTMELLALWMARRRHTMQIPGAGEGADVSSGAKSIIVGLCGERGQNARNLKRFDAIRHPTGLSLRSRIWVVFGHGSLWLCNCGDCAIARLEGTIPMACRACMTCMTCIK